MHVNMDRRRERFWIIVMILSLYILWIVPTTENFRKKPADRFYFGSVDYAIDVVGNLVTVREGFLGHWQRESKGTTVIAGKNSFLKMEYLLIGHFSRIVHIDPLIGFYLVRTLLSLAYFIVVYIVIALIFPVSSARILAFAYVLFSTGIIPPWQTYPFRIFDSMPGDTYVFQRMVTAMPHYMIGGIAPLLSLVFLTKFFDRTRSHYLFLSVLVGFIGTWVYAPSMLLVVLTIPAYVFIRLLGNTPKRTLVFEAGVLCFYAAVVLLPLLYIRYLWQFWDYSAFDRTEKIVSFRVRDMIEYLLIVGGTYALGVLATPWLLRTQSRLLLFLAPWLVVHPVAVLAFSNILNINPHRFFFGPYFAVFGILAAYGVTALFRTFGHTSRNLIHRGLIIVAALPFVCSFLVYGASLQRTTVCYCLIENADYGYPRQELMSAIFWLRDHTKEADVVLASPYAGVLVPAFAGNRVYTSWWIRIMDPAVYERTRIQSARIFSGQMSEDEARAFLEREKIGYVLYSQLPYRFLKRVYTSGETNVYRR